MFLDGRIGIYMDVNSLSYRTYFSWDTGDAYQPVQELEGDISNSTGDGLDLHLFPMDH